MRYTENRGHGKWIIPKNQLSEAAEKLARYEDAEEYEDIKPLVLQLRKTAHTVERNNQVAAGLLDLAADMIVKTDMWDNTQAKAILKKQAKHKKELLVFLDEIDGQIMDDPVALIREKVEEIL